MKSVITDVILFNYTATTEIYTIAYTLSLHDALPILFFAHNLGGKVCEKGVSLSLASPMSYANVSRWDYITIVLLGAAEAHVASSAVIFLKGA